MDIYKDFIQCLRKKELEEVFILINDDASLKLKQYVFLLVNVAFDDNNSHTYYGEVKRIIASFITYFNSTMEDCVVQADKYSNVIDKATFVTLIDNTIITYKQNQIEFRKEYLPVKTAAEKQIYDEIEEEYDSFVKKLNELRVRVGKFDKQEYVDTLAKEQCAISVVKISTIFNFTRLYLGMMAADSLNKIRVSIEGIYKRMYNNLKNVQEECEAGINNLLNKLYDKNKEKLAVTRSERKSSQDLAEVTRSIQNISCKIENFEPKAPLARLEHEVDYWKKRILEFNEVANNLTKLKTARDDIIKNEKKYSSVENEELIKRREHLTQLIIEETKALISFFAVRGSDRILYTDNIGPYYVDEFNHQVYVFDHGLAIYHVSCEGEFREIPDEAYYFDKFGRYINKDGEKIYQCAPCTSQYDVTNFSLLEKITKDCGHSEKENKTCRMLVTDPSKVETLPDIDPIDVSNSLDTETVKYLWDSFGSLLPEALYDVGTERPRNPIHFLAHRLIYHKYRRTTAELKEKKQEADKYRTEVFNKRHNVAKEASKKWKAKMVKRRNLEESDDTFTQAAYNAQVTEQMLVNSLNYFYT